jgi:hypothetical protein
VLGLALWGAQMRIGEVSPSQFGLVTEPDLQAVEWINENLPAEAYFLINGFLTPDEISVVGSDAGWWLPLYSGRSATILPATYQTEENYRADYRVFIRILAKEIRDYGFAHPDVTQTLVERGVTHLFIGQKQGKVNSPSLVFDPFPLIESFHFKEIYHQNRVWIFEVEP